MTIYLYWSTICIGNGGINGFLFLPFYLPDFKIITWFPSIVQRWPTSFVLFFKDYYELMNIFEEFQIISHIILLDIFEQLENLRQWCLWWLSNFLTCFELNLHISCSRYRINHFSKKFWFLKCKMGFGYHSLGRVLTDAWLGLFFLISCF